MTENNTNPGQSPYGGYGTPQQPPTTPQSPYTAPPTQPQGQSPYSAPQGQTPPPQFQNPYQAPQQAPQQGGHFPAPQKPLILETAYIVAAFSWMVGGHKFYLRQNMQGVAYAGAFLAMVIIANAISGFLGLLALGAIAVSAYADLRTLKEQVDRSNTGEVFPVPSQKYFIKKAFNRA